MVPETPLDPLGDSQIEMHDDGPPAEQVDSDIRLNDDESLYEATPPPSDSGVDDAPNDDDEQRAEQNPRAPADVPMPDADDDEQAEIDRKIARIRKNRRLASSRVELARLEDEEARGIGSGEDVGSDSFKQRLALERGKSVHEPDVYSGHSQRALDNFNKQVAMVFKMKPLTCGREEDKCIYAASRLAGIPSQERDVEDQRITADPTRTHSYDHFKAFLQEHKLPAYIRESALVLDLATIRQRNNQSVPELIAYLNKSEN